MMRDRRMPSVISWLSASVQSRIPTRGGSKLMPQPTGRLANVTLLPDAYDLPYGETSPYDADDTHQIDPAGDFDFDGMGGPGTASTTRPATPASSSSTLVTPMSSALTSTDYSKDVVSAGTALQSGNSSFAATQSPLASPTRSAKTAAASPRPAVAGSASAPGIDPKFRDLGMHLLRASDLERSRRGTPAYSAQVEQQVYVDGVRYLIMALPQTPDPSAPGGARPLMAAQLLGLTPEDFRSGDGSQNLQSMPQNTPAGYLPPPPPGKSILYKAVRLCVAQAILLVHFVLVQLVLLVRLLLPYVGASVRAVIRAERRHRVTERVLEQVLAVARAVGVTGKTVTGFVASLHSGWTGQSITGLLAWTVEGFADGFLDGIEVGRVTVAGAPHTPPASSTGS